MDLTIKTRRAFAIRIQNADTGHASAEIVDYHTRESIAHIWPTWKPLPFGGRERIWVCVIERKGLPPKYVRGGTLSAALREYELSEFTIERSRVVES